MKSTITKDFIVENGIASFPMKEYPNYCGIEDIGYVTHGEWTDAELEYKGKLFNETTVSDSMYERFIEEFPEKDGNYEAFNQYMADNKNQIYELLESEIDDMKVYDYSNLLQAVRETNTNKIIAENNRLADKKNVLSKMEMELKTSGLLDDWYDLKRLCREADIRIMPYGGWDEEKQGILMEDFQYFEDNGMFMKCMSSGSHWSDYFGFSYKDREFKWKICHTTSSTLFNGFDDELSEITTKIRLIELFMKRYEEYRNIQLQRVYTKIGKVTEETITIKRNTTE